MRSRTLLVLAGVAIGVGGTLLVTGPGLPPAAGQNPAAPNPLPQAVGKYQVSAFPGSNGFERGAYVLDTTTGEVFVTTGGNRPTSLGTPKPAK